MNDDRPWRVSLLAQSRHVTKYRKLLFFFSSSSSSSCSCSSSSGEDKTFRTWLFDTFVLVKFNRANMRTLTCVCNLTYERDQMMYTYHDSNTIPGISPLGIATSRLRVDRWWSVGFVQRRHDAPIGLYRDTSLSLRGINPRLSSVEPDLGPPLTINVVVRWVVLEPRTPPS